MCKFFISQKILMIMIRAASRIAAILHCIDALFDLWCTVGFVVNVVQDRFQNWSNFSVSVFLNVSYTPYWHFSARACVPTKWTNSHIFIQSD